MVKFYFSNSLSKNLILGIIHGIVEWFALEEP